MIGSSQRTGWPASERCKIQKSPKALQRSGIAHELVHTCFASLCHWLFAPEEIVQLPSSWCTKVELASARGLEPRGQSLPKVCC